jgi:hypothetical protein
MAGSIYDSYGEQQQDDWFANNAPPAPPPVDPAGAGLNYSVETAAPETQSQIDGTGDPTGSNGDPSQTTSPPAGPQNPGPQGVGDPGNNYNAVAGFYSTFLGRGGNASEINGWLNSGLDLGTIQNQIANSAEAQAYGSRGNSGGQGTMRDILAPFTGSWTPQNAPVFGQGGSPIAPFSFSRQLPVFQKFDAPTLEQARDEPGFQLALQEGTEGIQNSAAGRGLTRSGGTLKDILKYNQNFANQNYQNVYNRGFNTWQANTSGDLNNWLTGANADLNKYNTNVSTQYQMPFDAAMRSTGMNNDNSWKSYLQNYDQFKYNEQWPYQVLSDQQKIGISANQ